MVKINEDLKRKHNEYNRRLRIFEKIDSAIIENFGNKYLLVDIETEFHTNYENKKVVEADLVYVSEDRTAVIFVEETSDPSNKKNQLIGYSAITPENLRLLTGSDFTPYVDVFVVFPRKRRQIALDLYKEIEGEISKLGNKIGITLWYYPESKKFIKNAGGIFSKNFPKNKLQLNTKGIGTIKVLKKSVDPVSLLIFIVLEALSKEYGVTLGGIEMDKNKLSDLLTPYGIINKTKWRNAINIGEHVGWFDNVDLNQFNFTIKYSKVSPSSIAMSKKLTSNFFVAIEEEQDTLQASLSDFADIDKSLEKEKFDGDIEEED